MSHKYALLSLWLIGLTTMVISGMTPEQKRELQIKAAERYPGLQYHVFDDPFDVDKLDEYPLALKQHCPEYPNEKNYSGLLTCRFDLWPKIWENKRLAAEGKEAKKFDDKIEAALNWSQFCYYRLSPHLPSVKSWIKEGTSESFDNAIGEIQVCNELCVKPWERFQKTHNSESQKN